MAKKVLIVDDNESALQVYMAGFRMKGYDVIAAPGGQEALDALAKEKIDLVILDLAMPGVQGEDVMEKMATTPEWKEIPILVDTALGAETGRINKVKATFKDRLRVSYFIRPHSLEQLFNAVQEHVGL